MGEGVAWAWLEVDCIRNGAFWEWTDRGRISRECHGRRWGIAEKTLPGNHGKCDG